MNRFYYIKVSSEHFSAKTDIDLKRFREHADGRIVTLEGGVTRNEVFQFLKDHLIGCPYNLNNDAVNHYYLVDLELRKIKHCWIYPDINSWAFYGVTPEPLPIAHAIKNISKESIF